MGCVASCMVNGRSPAEPAETCSDPEGRFICVPSLLGFLRTNDSWRNESYLVRLHSRFSARAGRVFAFAFLIALRSSLMTQMEVTDGG